MNEKREESPNSIYVWWFILTIIYIIFNFFGHPVVINGGVAKVSLIDHFAGFIGLFVPFGLVSIKLLALPIVWLSVPVFFYGIYFLNNWLVSQKIQGFKKTVTILGLLFLLTVITDVARLMPFSSINIFIEGVIHSCC